MGAECFKNGGTLINIRPICASLANETSIWFTKMFMFEIIIGGGEVTKVEILVAYAWLGNSDFDIILGTNFMAQTKKEVTFDFWTKQIKIRSYKFDMWDRNKFTDTDLYDS